MCTRVCMMVEGRVGKEVLVGVDWPLFKPLISSVVVQIQEAIPTCSLDCQQVFVIACHIRSAPQLKPGMVISLSAGVTLL